MSDSYAAIGEGGSSDVDVVSDLSEQQLETPESPSNILDLSDMVTSHYPELAADDYATTPSIPESGPSPSSDYSAFFDLADLSTAGGPHDDDPGFYDDLCPSLSFNPRADWGEEPGKLEWAAVKTPAAMQLHLVPGFAPPTCTSCTCTHSSYSSLLSTDMDDMDDFMLVQDDDAFPTAPSSHFSLLPETDTNTTTTTPGWETGTTTPDTMEPLTPPYSVATTTTTTTVDSSTAVCTCASSIVAWDLLDELDRRI
ncbi:hypothetical protein C8A01DRAFT_31621 [Parachaetomium inaequale]|uniref:Uncharacterized protein n=1 Tax=Parachaetomium inaequale TaxID=2588326 RepID=A0AAN6PNH9_9PEZI|nr:hypothetical protein C8A01DRAFT_31621 [Parachaetomium inaequale]